MAALHYTIELTRREEAVEVHVDSAARICLVDERNYRRFCARQRFLYFGRSKCRKDVVIRPKAAGNWHLLIFGVPEGSKPRIQVV